MRNLALFVLMMMVFAGAVAGQSVVTDRMVITPWSVMDIPGDNPQFPVLSGPLSPAMGARLGLRPTRLEKETAVFNYSRSARRFLLDRLPAGELVWMDANGIPRYKQSCGNLLAPLPVRCGGCHTAIVTKAGEHAKTVPMKNLGAKKAGGRPSLWDRFWEAFVDFPWWIFPVLAIIGLAGYGLYRVLRDWDNNPAPRPDPAPPVRPGPVNPLPNPEPAPPAPPAPVPDPPEPEAEELNITVSEDGESAEVVVPSGTTFSMRQVPGGMRIRVSRAPRAPR